MHLPTKRTIIALSTLLIFAGCADLAPFTSTSKTSGSTIANVTPYTDPTGIIATYTTAGSIDTSGPFFQTLGANQRTCATCHQADQAMSINTATTLSLFNSTSGTDPLFTAVDGANCPTATTGNAAQHSLILNNGLIRVAVELPAGTQFTLTLLSDPYGCALTLDPTTGRQIVSTYRRPLPTSSLTYLSNVMWDTRETIDPLSSNNTFSSSLTADLTQQMLDAITNHEQGATAPTSSQIATVLAFEQGLFTAQATDNAAGSLSANNATGGPADLAAVTFYPGINDAFGGDPTGAAFNPTNVFALYANWNGPNASAAQASIFRGEKLFNTAPLKITDVSGINNNTSLNSPANVQGSCTTCHDTPSIGNHSLPLPLDTGIAHDTAVETDPNINAALGALSLPSLPIYQITGCKDANNKPVTYTTTDPGKGLFTGLCSDVNRVKVPILRGLAARAPYFHNGSAASIAQVVAFYNARFQMGLAPQQQTDLINFLNAL